MFGCFSCRLRPNRYVRCDLLCLRCCCKLLTQLELTYCIVTSSVFFFRQWNQSQTFKLMFMNVLYLVLFRLLHCKCVLMSLLLCIQCLLTQLELTYCIVISSVFHFRCWNQSQTFQLMFMSVLYSLLIRLLLCKCVLMYCVFVVDALVTTWNSLYLLFLVGYSRYDIETFLTISHQHVWLTSDCLWCPY